MPTPKHGLSAVAEARNNQPRVTQTSSSSSYFVTGTRTGPNFPPVCDSQREESSSPLRHIELVTSAR